MLLILKTRIIFKLFSLYPPGMVPPGIASVLLLEISGQFRTLNDTWHPVQVLSVALLVDTALTQGRTPNARRATRAIR